MDLLKRILNILAQNVLCVCVSCGQLLSCAHKLVLNLLKIIESCMATKLQTLKMIQRRNSVVKELHDCFFLVDWVLMKILLSPDHVINGGVNHLCHWSN